MSDEHAHTPSGSSERPSNPADTGPSALKPYEAPRLTEYGDIATLTQTGGKSQPDGKNPKKLKG